MPRAGRLHRPRRRPVLRADWTSSCRPQRPTPAIESRAAVRACGGRAASARRVAPVPRGHRAGGQPAATAC
eukprot:1658788-Prymnesium_polylepis.2